MQLTQYERQNFSGVAFVKLRSIEIENKRVEMFLQMLEKPSKHWNGPPVSGKEN